MGNLQSLSNNVPVSSATERLVLKQVSAGLLFSDSLASGNFNHSENGFYWQAGKNTSIATNFAHSGTNCIKVEYPKENANGYSWAEQGLKIPSSTYTELWIQWWTYLPDGTEGIGPKWEHTPNSTGKTSNNKYFLLYGIGRDSGAGNDWFNYAMEGNPSSGASSRDAKYRGVRDDNLFTYPTHHNCLPKTSYKFTAGHWIKQRVHCRLASFSNGVATTDGILKHWIDGQLIYGDDNVGTINCQGRHVRLASITEVKNVLHYCYFMGWANGGFQQATNVYIDDFEVAVRESDLS